MKAVVMRGKGSVDGLQLVDILEPEITLASEVKIRIRAAGVNPIDAKVRENGHFYPQPSLPIVLGCDGAGEIVAIGKQVSGFKVGDEVWFCNGGLGKEQGNYAEYTVLDSRWIALKPKNCTFSEAAAMPLVLMTAWGALIEKGNIQPGQTVLIHAGAGGVGHIAIQIAKLQGAKVITTVSTKEKETFVQALGVDHVINYSENGFADKVNQLTGGKGVDLVIDTVGADVFKESLAVTAYYGRVITLLDPGKQSLVEARVRNLLIGFELMLTPMLKGLNQERDKQIERLRKCSSWVERGDLKVHVSEIVSMDQVARVHSTIEQGHMIGKVVIDI